MCVTGQGEILEGYRLRDPDNGLIMPWYTWPCLEWLIGLDLKGKRIFEYGVGDSTWWFRKKGASVWGVDSDKEWAGSSKAIWEEAKDQYIYSLYIHFGYWDIVVNDGSFRDECTIHALASLKPGGYLIIDNYLQPSVQADWPLTENLIKGMPITIYKQPGHVDWVTAVITKI